MVTTFTVSGILTPDKLLVNGCSSTWGCPRVRVPNIVPSSECSTFHSSEYLSHPVSEEETVAEMVSNYYDFPSNCCCSWTPLLLPHEHSLPPHSEQKLVLVRAHIKPVGPAQNVAPFRVETKRNILLTIRLL